MSLHKLKLRRIKIAEQGLYMNSFNTNPKGLENKFYEILQRDPSLGREQRNRLGSMVASFAYAGEDETIYSVAARQYRTNFPYETGHLTTRIVIPNGFIATPDHLQA